MYVEDKRADVEEITNQVVIGKGNVEFDLLYTPAPAPLDRDKKATYQHGHVAFLPSVPVTLKGASLSVRRTLF